MRCEKIRSCYEKFCIEKQFHCRKRYIRCYKETSTFVEKFVVARFDINTSCVYLFTLFSNWYMKLIRIRSLEHWFDENRVLFFEVQRIRSNRCSRRFYFWSWSWFREIDIFIDTNKLYFDEYLTEILILSYHFLER